jgi:putative membrane protein
MKRPIARPTAPPEPEADQTVRAPRAFAPSQLEAVETAPPEFDAMEETFDPEPRLPRSRWLGRLAWGAAGILVSLALGLAAEQLIRELFERYAWLGWFGVATLAVFVLAIVILAIREIIAVRRLRNLEGLRHRAAAVLRSDKPAEGRAIINELNGLYLGRPDLARARDGLDVHAKSSFDGAEMVRLAERTLMTPLDARAKALTAASARRVALVTAVSPRALIDMGFVVFESIRLGGTIARLYGARPGFVGFLRLAGAILSHLAVTGGLLLTDGLVEQLIGQGAAAKISARLGEGVVNGLMTVRVGIAAMRVVRPLPFETQKQPMVKDFIGELVNVTKMTTSSPNG